MREHIWRKAKEMKQLNDISMKGEIVVFGSTYMAGFPLYELANRCMLEHAIYNRSIEGLTVEEALAIAEDCIVDIRPSKLFLALGEEDAENSDVLEAYTRLVSMLQKQLPDCRLFLIGLTGTDAYAKRLNAHLQSLCGGKKMQYIAFVSHEHSESALYRARFKQLSCCFRDRALTVPEAFAMAEL